MAKIQAPTDPWTRFALGIFKLNGLIMAIGEVISRQVGQTSARWQVLGRVFEPRTVPDIAREVGYARQSIQRVADVLAEEGLLVYKDHPSDKRTKLAELTPTGLEVLTAIYMRQLAWSDKILTKLDATELGRLADSLTEVASVLEAHGHPDEKGGQDDTSGTEI